MNIIEQAYLKLKQGLGDSRVSIDRDILEAYSRDETSDIAAMPEILVRAESTNDVSFTLEVCNEYGLPVVPRGAGSGVTGGAVPVFGGVVLSLEKMNRILEIDKKNMVAVVEPGVITGDLQRAVLAEGLVYPPDPASLDICSIGGNVAEIAGGPRAVKYGTTRDYILGLEIVLPDGSIISTGGKYVKDAVGYNLVGIILGSEGTLAVITRIILKLIPAPRYSLDLLVPFDSLDDAINAVFSIIERRIVPAALEFMEEDAIKLVAGFLKSDMPFPLAGAHLMIQIDGNSEEQLDDDLEKITEVIGVEQEKIIVAASDIHRQRLWKARRSIREAIKAESPVFLAEDCVVPRANIPVFLIELKKYLSSMGLNSVMFGHAGDGNVHIDILKGAMDYQHWLDIVPVLKKEIYSRALKLGGTITGEHGIGFIRKNYLGLALSEEEIELLKRIKLAFDPNGILNPGKMFP